MPQWPLIQAASSAASRAGAVRIAFVATLPATDATGSPEPAVSASAAAQRSVVLTGRVRSSRRRY